MLRRRNLLLAVLFLGVACAGSLGEPLTSDPASTGGFPSFLRNSWKTDFTKASVSPEELTQGASKGGIPAIDLPVFVSVDAVDFLNDREPASPSRRAARRALTPYRSSPGTRSSTT